MIVILSGTNRPQSNTKKVALKVQAAFQKVIAERELAFLDLTNLRPEIFDTGSYQQKPKWFLDEFQSVISAASGIVVVTPEYNGSFPGVLKYFVDMLEFPKSLAGVSAGFIGVAAGQFGALRSIEQMSMIFQYRKAQLFGGRVMIPDVNGAFADSNRMKEYDDRIAEFVNGFVKFTLPNRPLS